MTTVVETFTVGTLSGRVLDLGTASEVTLSPPFVIPQTATSVSVRLRSSYIWNTFLNVTAETGNRLTILDVQTSIMWDFYFPDGQYNVDSLFDYFTRESKQRGAPWISVAQGNTMLLRFDADNAVQKIVFTNNTPGRTFRIKWDGGYETSQTETIWKLLGFEKKSSTDLLGPGQDTSFYGSYAYGSTQAAFNTVNGVLIKCNLITRGIRVNGEYVSVLAQVPITAGPGELMVYEPQMQSMSEPSLFGGVSIQKVSVQICDDLGNPASTPGNPWLVTIDISYDLL